MMNKVFFLLFLSATTTSLLSGQDYIKNLTHNPVLAKKHHFQQKNTPFDACIGGLPFLNIALQDTIKPTTAESDGGFLIAIYSNLEQVDFYVNGNFAGSSSGENSIELGNLAAGIYTIEAVGDNGLNDELYIGLSNNSLEGLGDGTFLTRTEFCGEGGKIIKTNTISSESVLYDILDLNGNKYYTFGVLADSVEVPAGKYYAYYFDRFGDKDEFFWPIEVPVETPAPFPFFDDFSDTDVYPNLLRWKDSTAYVNQTLAYAPPSIGVASLDGLNQYGKPYFPADIQIDGLADKFHSNRFCMDNLTPSDSLYFSFFYQGKGNGDLPNPTDSLFVEFLNKDGQWVRQWATNFEYNETDLVTDARFTPVSIAITDSSYFFKGFQFRFANRATLNGQNDHWHIDYVELNSYPGGYLPIFDDITFIYPAPSILSRYSAMPWYQFEGFESQELVDKIDLVVRNNKGTATAILSATEVKEVCTDELINVEESFGFRNFMPFEESILNFTPSNFLPLEPQENVVLDFTFKIEDDGDKITTNNTLKHRQFFSNYLAYDDGSPEKAIGYEKNGAQLAQKYYINKPDSLVGLMIYFTHIVQDISSSEFYLMAWNNINTSENQALNDEVIARSSSTRNPVYTDGITNFTVYTFDQPVAVADSFFVGYQQILDKNLSVGFDVFQPYLVGSEAAEYSKNARLNTFFNDQAVWENSSYEGAAMIRPILASSQNIIPTATQTVPENTVNIYPNPATNTLYLNWNTPETANIEIHSVDGKLVLKQNNTAQESLDISSLNSGLYLLTIQTESGFFSSAKFVKE